MFIFRQKKVLFFYFCGLCFLLLRVWKSTITSLKTTHLFICLSAYSERTLWVCLLWLACAEFLHCISENHHIICLSAYSEKARLQAEAKAAEEARKRAEAEAAAEAKRKRELEREAARQALQKVKTDGFTFIEKLSLYNS